MIQHKLLLFYESSADDLIKRRGEFCRGGNLSPTKSPKNFYSCTFKSKNSIASYQSTCSDPNNCSMYRLTGLNTHLYLISCAMFRLTGLDVHTGTHTLPSHYFPWETAFSWWKRGFYGGNGISSSASHHHSPPSHYFLWWKRHVQLRAPPLTNHFVCLLDLFYNGFAYSKDSKTLNFIELGAVGDLL